MKSATLIGLAAAISTTMACNSCYAPTSEVVHERFVRRMQPGADGTLAEPRAPLEWGQLNFLHTTDTHGWLEGHIREQNYGADWGDFVSFSRHMKQKAARLGVDLLLIDTGDLHDGTGLSDTSSPNGVLTNPIFDEIDYDVLAIGNHELYISEVAYEHFYNFSKVWGEKYITSNVQIINPVTNQLEYMGAKYRYFTTSHGIRIMAFGVLFDFVGNSNVSKVTKAEDMVKQQWFIDAVTFEQPIDIFLLVGHNPIRTTDPISTWATVRNLIRSFHPQVPIQVFGGHTHIRDFEVYDDYSTGFEAGRYCETLGWVSICGINSTTYTGSKKPHGVPNPTRKLTANSTSGITVSRRYLDWNRRTLSYHSVRSADEKFDYHSGLRVTSEITDIRKKLDIEKLYGCVPDTYCISCQPIGTPRSIFKVISDALEAIAFRPDRSTIPRVIVINTGGVRFDLVKGPFTVDDSYIVVPFFNIFQYIPNVPYYYAKTVLATLNGLHGVVKRDGPGITWGSMPQVRDTCLDPTVGAISDFSGIIENRGHHHRDITRRQTIVTPGYTTVDDFGTDGDDTPHSNIPNYPLPNYIQVNASFPTNSSEPDAVDLVFLNYFAARVVKILNDLGGSYTLNDIDYLIDKNFTTHSYLIEYAKRNWQANMPNCPGGPGVGS